MNAISIGYRFSRDELSTLLQALRIDGLPGAPLRPVDGSAAHDVLDRLCGEGMVMLADDTLYIDKLIGYLLRAAAGAGSAVALTDASRTNVLWKTDRLLILGDFPAEGECTLTPLQDDDSAQVALTDAICRMNRPLWAMSIFAPDRRFSVPEGNPLSEGQIALEVMALMQG